MKVLRHRPWLASFTVFVALFLLAPGIDLWATGLFYREGEGFFLGRPLLPIHDAVPWLTRLLLFGLLGGILFASLSAAARASRKALFYLLTVLLIGPGLLVNTVFKDQWGRARPAQVQEFGGTAQFSPAWVPSNQCARNCAFVCGDASVGFFLLAPAFLFAQRRRTWLAVGLVTGGFLGLVRMAQGGHFLSDVIFSFYVVYFSAWLLHRMFYPEKSQPAIAQNGG